MNKRLLMIITMIVMIIFGAVGYAMLRPKTENLEDSVVLDDRAFLKELLKEATPEEAKEIKKEMKRLQKKKNFW